MPMSVRETIKTPADAEHRIWQSLRNGRNFDQHKIRIFFNESNHKMKHVFVCAHRRESRLCARKECENAIKHSVLIKSKVAKLNVKYAKNYLHLQTIQS